MGRTRIYDDAHYDDAAEEMLNGLDLTEEYTKDELLDRADLPGRKHWPSLRAALERVRPEYGWQEATTTNGWRIVGRAISSNYKNHLQRNAMMLAAWRREVVESCANSASAASIAASLIDSDINPIQLIMEMAVTHDAEGRSLALPEVLAAELIGATVELLPTASRDIQERINRSMQEAGHLAEGIETKLLEARDKLN